MKTVWVILAGFLVNIAAGDLVVFNSNSATNNWSSKGVSASDTVVVNNDAVVLFDCNSTASYVRVSNTDDSGTLIISQKNLTVTGRLQLGLASGRGIVTQSAGFVNSPYIDINQSGAGDLCRYDIAGGGATASIRLTVNRGGIQTLSDGSLTTPELNMSGDGELQVTGSGEFHLNGSATLADDAVLEVDGGTLRNWSPGTCVYSGSGTVLVRSGTLNVNAYTINNTTLDMGLFNVLGGNIYLGRVMVGRYTNAIFRVFGDNATILMNSIDQSFGGAESGTFRFVFSKTGISGITVGAGIDMEAAELEVYGQNYTNGPANFTLFNSANLLSAFAISNITVSGFNENGYRAQVVQDSVTGDISVEVTQKKIWILENNLGTGGHINDYDEVFQESHLTEWAGARSYLNAYFFHPRDLLTDPIYTNNNYSYVSNLVSVLNSNNIAIGLESFAALWAMGDAGATNRLTYFFNIDTNAIHLIESFGGTVKYINMLSVLSKIVDPTVWPNTQIYAEVSVNSVQQRAQDMGAYIQRMRAVYPDIKIGELDSLIRFPEWRDGSGYEVVANQLGTNAAPDFWIVDLAYEYPAYTNHGIVWADFANAQQVVNSNFPSAEFGVVTASLISKTNLDGLYVEIDPVDPLDFQTFVNTWSVLGALKNAGCYPDIYFSNLYFPEPTHLLPDTTSTTNYSQMRTIKTIGEELYAPDSEF